jgi:hypothetical protein
MLMNRLFLMNTHSLSIMFLTFVMLSPQENLSITFHIKHDDQIKCVNAMFKDMFKHHNTKQTLESVCM